MSPGTCSYGFVKSFKAMMASGICGYVILKVLRL